MNIILGILVLGLLIVLIAGMWKTFEKAGEDGWKAIVPILNTITLAKIVGKEWWWGLLAIIPYVGIIFNIILLNRLSKSFGKDVGMTIALIFAVGFLILGFGDAQFIGPNGESAEIDETDSLLTQEDI